MLLIFILPFVGINMIFPWWCGWYLNYVVILGFLDFCNIVYLLVKSEYFLDFK